MVTDYSMIVRAASEQAVANAQAFVPLQQIASPGCTGMGVLSYGNIGYGLLGNSGHYTIKYTNTVSPRRQKLLLLT